jgi:hypothetical protein
MAPPAAGRPEVSDLRALAAAAVPGHCGVGGAPFPSATLGSRAEGAAFEG